MADVAFYHCTRSPAESVAVQLAARAYASGARLLVVGSAQTLGSLDQRLWTDMPDSFIPHGRVDADAARHPVLLAESPEPLNGASMLLLVAHPLPEALPFARVLHLFEDGSEAHARARTEWKRLPAAARTYWQQDAGGRWERKG